MSRVRFFCHNACLREQGSRTKLWPWWKKGSARTRPIGGFISLWDSSLIWFATITRLRSKPFRRDQRYRALCLDEGDGRAHGGKGRGRRNRHLSLEDDLRHHF